MHAEPLHREDRIGARRHVAEQLARETQRARIHLPARRRDELEQIRLRERQHRATITGGFVVTALRGVDRIACPYEARAELGVRVREEHRQVFVR